MNLKQLFGEYTLGEAQKHKNLAIVPIIRKKDSLLEYILLQEGLSSGKVKVIETGVVNNLRIRKDTGEDLLFIKGEYIVGGKQNRQLSANGLMRKSELDVPAHCVQHGRWGYSGNFGSRGSPEFSHSPSFVAASLRSSVSKEGSRGAQQS